MAESSKDKKAGESGRAGGVSLAARRRKARTLTMQALYQWQLSGNSITSIEAEYLAENDLDKVDVPYFRELLKGVTSTLSELDAELAPFLNRSVESLDPIEKALVRMGTYELKHRIDVPYRVVINEAIDLAKKFGGTDGHKFVNGLLDKVGAKLRPHETAKR